jgi:hypothetical protein
MDGAPPTSDVGVVDGDAGVAPPSLDALSITQQPLVPPFSPDVHDYVVRCAAGSNAMTVTARASNGSTAAILRPSTTPLVDDRAQMLSLTENQAIVVEATAASGATEDYWVRCLPHDFPALSATLTGDAWPGYYLLGNSAVGTGEAGYAMVLDGRGTPVWYRGTTTGACFVSSPAPNTIAYSPLLGATFGTTPDGHFTAVQLSSDASTSIAAVGSPTDMHELLPLASGGYMLLSYSITDGIDLFPAGIASQKIADCRVQELAADGHLVWEWLASDHFDALVESTDLVQTMVDGESVTDAFHCNSIDVSATGDVLVSARNMDAVFLVSRATGKVVWKLGGVRSNKDGATLVSLEGDAEGGFFHQHDARFLADGALSLFDDHQPAGGPARAIELTLDLANARASTRWQYAATAPSSAMGSYRRDADGTALIGWGVLSASTLAFTDLDVAGAPKLEVSFPGGDRLYRAVKVPRERLDLRAMRETAGESATSAPSP